MFMILISKRKQILSSLQHQNIIQYIPNNLFHLQIPQASFILIEYAPYGDFLNIILQKNLSNEKLVRTFFHHIIQGLECLHLKGIAHLDIKLENLLLGKNFQLKIADFDVAQNVNDDNLLSDGTENYRAPEIQNSTCIDYRAADIFSTGICLFALISRAFPFLEELNNGSFGNIQSYKQYVQNKEEFWRSIEGFLGEKIHFSENLKELLEGMFTKDPNLRFNLKQIKSSRWYNEPTYTEKEVQIVMKELF